ncbi:MAG TPA: glycosyltransferase [Solirubrobacteraceae bacterium]|nr:glycosyltransferase [Solirubrobacteraceae bacterium]
MAEHERMGAGAMGSAHNARAATPTGAEQRLSGRDIVCVGFNDWDTELWTNQHHLMARLARDNRVLFIESLGLRRPTLAGRDLRRIGRRVRNGLAGPRVAAAHPGGGSLHVLSPLVLPFHRHALARVLNRVLLGWLVGRAARRIGMRKPILWGYVPQAQSLRAALEPALTVYHCVDDIAAQERIDTGAFRAAERVFAAQADLVLASAPKLAERLGECNEHVELLPNVADTELFASALRAGPVDPELARVSSPRVLFTGAIAAAKLDFELLIGVARARRQWSIVLVGPVGLGDPHTDVSRLRAEPNVHLLDARGYEQLPALARGADAGLIPYARNALTESIFPMKVYEYLAAGLPVLATRLPALAGVEDIEFADDAGAAVQALERMLAEDSPAARAARSERAHGHSWEARLEEISGLIAAAEQRRAEPGRAERGREQSEPGRAEREHEQPEHRQAQRGRRRG